MKSQNTGTYTLYFIQKSRKLHLHCNKVNWEAITKFYIPVLHSKPQCKYFNGLFLNLWRLNVLRSCWFILCIFVIFFFDLFYFVGLFSFLCCAALFLFRLQWRWLFPSIFLAFFDCDCLRNQLVKRILDVDQTVHAFNKPSDLLLGQNAQTSVPVFRPPSLLLFRDFFGDANHETSLHFNDLVLSVLRNHFVALWWWKRIRSSGIFLIIFSMFCFTAKAL